MNETVKPNPVREAEAITPQPWWRYGHVWLLVIAGPLLVVIASFVTFWLAVATSDPVLGDASPASYNADVAQGNKVAADRTQQTALAPAMQARNHLTVPAGSAR